MPTRCVSANRTCIRVDHQHPFVASQPEQRIHDRDAVATCTAKRTRQRHARWEPESHRTPWFVGYASESTKPNVGLGQVRPEILGELELGVVSNEGQSPAPLHQRLGATGGQHLLQLREVRIPLIPCTLDGRRLGPVAEGLHHRPARLYRGPDLFLDGTCCLGRAPSAQRTG